MLYNYIGCTVPGKPLCKHDVERQLYHKIKKAYCKKENELFSPCRYGPILFWLTIQQQFLVIFHSSFNVDLTTLTNFSLSIRCSNKLMLHKSGMLFHTVAKSFVSALSQWK